MQVLKDKTIDGFNRPRLNVPRQLTIHECEESYGFLKNHSKERDRKDDLDPHCGGTGGNTDLGGRGQEPAWSIEAKMISADSCSVGCPWILGEPPTHGQCQFVALWQVDKGQYGDLKLDGLKFAFAGEFAQKVIGEPVKKAFVAHYIDSGASAEQKEALR